MNPDSKDLENLFKLADQIGNRRYHKLTPQDLEDYQKFNYWRYINGGDRQHGTTLASQQWAKDNSDWHCPSCGERFADVGGRTIDHKLPRAQYPWLSLDFRNLWVICRRCNQEKGEMHWYEYEHYMLIHHRDRYDDVRLVRPTHLLKSLKSEP
ncbi:MAG: HNH endonuclease [Leptolyngbyaceae cyanobacterium SM1_1_3]|nr:HNH endonuclease [Leptolyngbyaceae cyanobacterium SM1_1_3]NJN01502.1 HNH endonuclease [Leptolyngbyaceae cyanobacterium RM1_1_2]